jgi:hypothetical protein
VSCGGEFEEPDDWHRRLERLVMGSQGDKMIAGVCAQFACDRKRRGNDGWGRIARGERLSGLRGTRYNDSRGLGMHLGRGIWRKSCIIW